MFANAPRQVFSRFRFWDGGAMRQGYLRTGRADRRAGMVVVCGASLMPPPSAFVSRNAHLLIERRESDDALLTLFYGTLRRFSSKW